MATPRKAGSYNGLNNSELFNLFSFWIISNSTSIAAKYVKIVHKLAHLDH